MIRKLAIATVLAWVGLWAQSAGAIDPEVRFEDPVMEERYRGLIHELRCMVCQNQSIAESNADLAQDLREQVAEMLHEGRTDEEILSYMTDRYGDFVRYDPPVNQRTWLLWGGPFILLVIGLLFLVPAIMRRAGVAGDPADEEDE